MATDFKKSTGVGALRASGMAELVAGAAQRTGLSGRA